MYHITKIFSFLPFASFKCEQLSINDFKIAQRVWLASLELDRKIVVFRQYPPVDTNNFTHNKVVVYHYKSEKYEEINFSLQLYFTK